MSAVQISSSSESKKTQEELAANYALQVALQTMKERCQQLQARLSVVEEENLQLKIEKQRQLRQENKINISNFCDIDKLQEQIAQLSRQKSQLTHHIYMVATENKHLWTRLSLLTEANESLGTRLNKISTALSSHSNKTEQLLHEINHDIGNQSLEEISLKLINNIQQEKCELEQQYADMVELQSFKDCDFTLTNTDDSNYKHNCEINEDEEEAIHELLSNDLKQCKQQLTKFLLSLKYQKEILQSSINSLNLYAKGEESCLICREYLEGAKKVYCDVQVMTLPFEIMEKDSVDKEEVQNINENLKVCKCKIKSKQRTCPMCNCIYSNIHNETFIEHVRSHFPLIEVMDDEFDQFYHDHSSSVV